MSGRFVSEFGMEAYPHLATTRSAITKQSQQYPGSMMMDYHNCAIDHERRVLTYVAENFRIKYDLESFTHLTQIVQADAMTFAYRGWRRDWGTAGKRKCGGVLVWQLNDCWPTMSWAVVDYYRVKKPAFYAIKRALKPLAVNVGGKYHEWTAGHSDPTVAGRDNKYDVWVASSRTESVQVDVAVRFISIATGNDVGEAVTKTVRVTPNATTEVIVQGKVPIDVGLDSTKPFDVNKHDPFVIHASLAVDGRTVSTDVAWPHPLKYIDFADRGVSVQQSERGDKLFVRAEKPVHGFVLQERRDWVGLSDNGFDVVPGEDVVIDITGEKVMKEEVKWTYIGAEKGEIGFDVAGHHL